MGNWKSILRYVPEGQPTLLETFEEVLAAERERVEVSERQLLKWFGLRRAATVRAMLRHERMLDLATMMQLVNFLNLTYEEASARYYANAPSAKIGEYEQAMRKIAALHEVARRRPCRRILVDTTAPLRVATSRIYYPG